MDILKKIFDRDILETLRREPSLIPSLINLLSSKDKDIKHKSWEIIQKLIEEGVIKDKSLILSLLCYKDEGSRYRVWNFVPKLVDLKIIDGNDIRNNKECLYQMLTSNNTDVRALTWYSTLPQILEYIDKREISEIIKYCKDLLNTSWKDLIEETCNELG
jgi:hypothetical protein